LKLAQATERENTMGDKSPKSQKRQQKQKQAVKQQGAADARAKQTPATVTAEKRK
jgi:hypothetical protein